MNEDQLGPEWEGMGGQDVIRKINAQLHNGWRITLVRLSERVKLQMATPWMAEWGSRHYEYGETLDEAVANAVRYSRENGED